MKNLLVTGGAGFIGSHVVRLLLEKGYRVSVMDSLLTGKRENLAEVEGDLSVFFIADIRDPEACLEATKGIDCVLHQAALPSVPRSVEDPALTNGINVGGTLNMLLAARENGVKRFVFASSSSVYGETPTLPKREDQAPAPLSPYAIQKLTAEHYCRVFNSLFGLETLCLRYFNVFGPRQDPQSQYAAVIPKFITAALDGLPLTVFGDGSQSRDFTFAADVARANLKAVEAGETAGEIVNIACGKRNTLNEFIGILARLHGGKLEVKNLPPRAGDIKDSLADIGRAEKLLGYRPGTSFEEGVGETFDWYKERIEK